VTNFILFFYLISLFTNFMMNLEGFSVKIIFNTIICLVVWYILVTILYTHVCISITYPCFLGAVSDIDGEVNCFYHTTKCIDGDDKHFTRFYVSIKYPKHCTEECSHIWSRLETSRCFLLTNLIKYWSAKYTYIHVCVYLN